MQEIIQQIVLDRLKILCKFGECEGQPMGLVERNVSYRDTIVHDLIIYKKKIRKKLICNSCKGHHRTIDCLKQPAASSATTTAPTNVYRPKRAAYSTSSTTQDTALSCIKLDNFPRHCSKEQLERIIRQVIHQHIEIKNKYSTRIIQRCNLLYDRETGYSRGIAYITLHKKEYADILIEKLNRYKLDSCILTVEIAPVNNYKPDPKPKRKYKHTKQNYYKKNYRYH